MAWGQQIDAAVVTDAENGRRRAAAYLAKYATKGSDEHGVLDHRLRSGPPSDRRLPDHLRTLVETAWELGRNRRSPSSAWSSGPTPAGSGATSSPSPAATRRPSAPCGANGSAGNERQPVRGSDECGSDEVEFREWNYEGSGYLTAGDVCLARNLEEGLRLGRHAAHRGNTGSARRRHHTTADRWRVGWCDAEWTDGKSVDEAVFLVSWRCCPNSRRRRRLLH